MEKVIAFLTQPFVLEILKGLIALNFGVLIGIFYSDWKQERRVQKNDASNDSEAEQEG